MQQPGTAVSGTETAGQQLDGLWTPEVVADSPDPDSGFTAGETRNPDPSKPPAHLPHPKLAANAQTVLAKRYLKKDAAGRPTEEPRDMFWRVAAVIASEDLKHGADPETATALAERFYNMMAEGEFEPNSPTLMNAGRPLGQLSACFVLPVPDSLKGIYETLRDMAVIHQSGGGTGFGFSRLRPSGDVVNSTMGVASGPVSFMEVYDASTEAVKQGGTRRGANMGILRVDHPDILNFIDCKADRTKVTNFNISVGVTDAFMRAVEADEEYDLLSPRTRESVGQLKAAEVFDKIVEGAWRNGEPGVFFIDEANRYNPVPHVGDYEATNPCGEQPLLPYDVCNLGSVNIGFYVSEDGEIDWEGMRKGIADSIHFLDNVIDANKYPLPRIDDLSKRIRRVGLGVMGWADTLVRAGIAYGSKESVELGEKVMKFVDEASRAESQRLAEERGEFPEWAESIWGPDETCARTPDGKRVQPEQRLRNCNLTTVAPTGTISIIAGCSSGIEPLFAVAFMRNQAGSLMPDVNDDFVERAKAGGWHSDELMGRIAGEGHIHFDDVPTETQRVFVTAHDVTPEQHIRMQAAFQRHTHSAISKTCNFPTTATIADVREIYELAFALKCKGVTVYRDGSRDEQVLSTGAQARAVRDQTLRSGSAAAVDGALSEAAALGDASGVDGDGTDELVDAVQENQRLKVEMTQLREANRESGEANRVLSTQLENLERRLSLAEGESLPRLSTRERPSLLRGQTRRMDTPLGVMYVTINEDEKRRPFEVFVALGKGGGAATADAEAIGRLCSLALRSGVSLDHVHKQLRGISSDRAIGIGPSKVLSGPDAIAQAMERYLADREGIQLQLGQDARSFIGHCPDCNSALAFEEGCEKCHSCGYSQCG